VARKRKPRGEPDRETTKPTSAPTEEEWQRTIEIFFVLRSLGSAASRRHAERLAVALDQEALVVLRVARRLENEFPPVSDLKELTTKHGRSSIVANLRDYTKRHVDFAKLDDLDEQIGRSVASWYRQGGLLLDAAERVRANVALYEYVDIHRPESELGTVAWSYIVERAARWGVSDGEVARRLAGAGYPGADRDLFHLKENVKKHRLRRKPRRPRRRLSTR
jgi:hypothetical protein